MCFTTFSVTAATKYRSKNANFGAMLAHVGPMLAHLGAYVGAISAVFLAIYVAAMLKHLQDANFSDFSPPRSPKPRKNYDF